MSAYFARFAFAAPPARSPRPPRRKPSPTRTVGRRRRHHRHHRHGRLQGQGLAGVGHGGRPQRRGAGATARRRHRPAHHGEQLQKAFTARTFRIPSGEMEKRLKDNPQMGAAISTGFTTGAARCRSRSAKTWSAPPASPARRAARRTRPACRPASTRSRTVEVARQRRSRSARSAGPAHPAGAQSGRCLTISPSATPRSAP